MPEGKREQYLLPGKVLFRHGYKDLNNILISTLSVIVFVFIYFYFYFCAVRVD